MQYSRIFRKNTYLNNLKINILHYCYIQVFGIADLTGISRKKSPPHLVSLIKVEGLFSPYIVTHFDIVHSESLVLRYIQLVPSLDGIKPIFLSDV